MWMWVLFLCLSLTNGLTCTFYQNQSSLLSHLSVGDRFISECNGWQDCRSKESKLKQVSQWSVLQWGLHWRTGGHFHTSAKNIKACGQVAQSVLRCHEFFQTMFTGSSFKSCVDTVWWISVCAWTPLLPWQLWQVGCRPMCACLSFCSVVPYCWSFHAAECHCVKWRHSLFKRTWMKALKSHSNQLLIDWKGFPVVV